MARYFCVPETWLADWNAMPDSPAQQSIDAADFAPYGGFNYDSTGLFTPTGMGVTFSSATYMTNEVYGWNNTAPGGTALAVIAGTAMPINNATVESNNNLLPDTPLGPIEISFQRSGSPLQASSVGIGIYAEALISDAFGTWTTPAYDNILVTALAANGSNAASPVALSSLSAESGVEFWGNYNFSPASPSVGTKDAEFRILTTDCYGIRIEHADPGNDNPYVLVINGLFVELTLPPASTYLRQRQSPVRTPSRVRPPQLRQRQRPEVT